MADNALQEKIQDLSDLELATLLCFINQEHCIIDTEPDAIDDLADELKLVASKVFGLSHALIDCSEHTTHDDLANSILADAYPTTRAESPVRTRQDSYLLQSPPFRSLSRSTRTDTFGSSRKIANVIIAKNLDEAPKLVQIQALELMKTKRIFTHTSVQTAPKRFLFIALIAGGDGPRLTNHLNDHMFISHFHDLEDGFPNLDELNSDNDSISSVVHSKNIDDEFEAVSEPMIKAEDIEVLQRLTDETTLSIDITRYLRDIIAFLRLHRAVGGDISPLATRHFEKLVKSLAPLHGLHYVTPSLASLATKKIYAHRIKIVSPENERSMQWGSNLDAIKAALEGIGPEDVIQDVLDSVEVPL